MSLWIVCKYIVVTVCVLQFITQLVECILTHQRAYSHLSVFLVNTSYSACSMLSCTVMILLFELCCVDIESIDCSWYRDIASLLTIGASIICNRMPGLAPLQRTMCLTRPDAMILVSEAGKMALAECRYQFRSSRWNCTNIDGDHVVLGVPPRLSK